MSLSRNSAIPHRARFTHFPSVMCRGASGLSLEFKDLGGRQQAAASQGASKLAHSKDAPWSAVACCRLSLAKLASPVPHMHRTVLKRSLMTSATQIKGLPSRAFLLAEGTNRRSAKQATPDVSTSRDYTTALCWEYFIVAASLHAGARQIIVLIVEPLDFSRAPCLAQPLLSTTPSR
jgi:hypothetical protein